MLVGAAKIFYIYHIRQYPVTRHFGKVPIDQAEERFEVAHRVSKKEYWDQQAHDSNK